MSASNKTVGNAGGSAQGTSGNNAGANDGRKPGRDDKGKKRQATSPANEDDVERRKRLRLDRLHALQEQEREFRERETEMREAVERTAALRAWLAELDEGDPTGCRTGCRTEPDPGPGAGRFRGTGVGGD